MDISAVELAEARVLASIFSNKNYKDVPKDLFITNSGKNAFKVLSSLIDQNSLSLEALHNGMIALDPTISPEYSQIIANGNDAPVTDAVRILSNVQSSAKMVDKLIAAQTVLASKPFTKETLDEVRALVREVESTMDNSEEEELDICSFDQIYLRYIEHFDQRRNGKQWNFMNFIFDDLIEEGPAPGQIGILTSSSGSGKSTLCANLIFSLLSWNIPVMYFSLEMSEDNTMDRFLAKKCKIPFKKLINPGEDFDDIRNIIEEAWKDLMKKDRFGFSANPHLNCKKLRKEIRAFKKKHNVDYAIVFIDLLSMMSDFAKGQEGANVAQVAEFSMNELSAVAKDENVHIIGVVQQNQSSEADAHISSVEDLEKLRPSRAHIKNASAYLERARYVITAFRPKAYAQLYLSPDEVAVMDDIMHVTCVKQNNGLVGKDVQCLFDGEHFSIDPIEDTMTDFEALNINEENEEDYTPTDGVNGWDEE